MIAQWLLRIRWWWISWRYRDYPQHHPRILHRRIVLLSQDLFKNHDPVRAAQIKFHSHNANVNDFMERVVALLQCVQTHQYITRNNLVVVGQLKHTNVDAFLLTRTQRHPILPSEFLQEFHQTLDYIVQALDDEKMDPNYRDYFLRKSEWVFHDGYVIIEAMYRLARTL